MALKATIFKAALQIADMDRNYYGEHTLTIARHPSETDERMMVRVLAFALHADERLSFGRGLSDEDEPDVWEKDLTGAITTWIDVGLPDDKRIRKAAGRAGQVYVYSYGAAHGTRLWWEQVEGKLDKTRNVSVIRLATTETRELASLADRNMRLTCTVQDGQIWLGNDGASVEVHPETVKAPQQRRR
ncbi:MAG: YaeQ family protein [Betaproteobacteria bacterium]|nr:YaeQ family protein [Betaproteobacteria bacterium]